MLPSVAQQLCNFSAQNTKASKFTDTLQPLALPGMYDRIENFQVPPRGCFPYGAYGMPEEKVGQRMCSACVVQLFGRPC